MSDGDRTREEGGGPAAAPGTEQPRGRKRSERLRRVARTVLPTVLVIIGAEVGAQLGLYWRDLGWPFVAFLLFGTSVIAAQAAGKAAGVTSAVIAVMYSTADLAAPSVRPLPIEALELRRYLIYPAVLVPVAWLIGWQRDWIRRAYREECDLRRAAEHARDEAQDAARRERFLAEAGDALTASLDVERTLETLAHLAVPDLADACVIDIEQDGRPRRVAHAAVDPERDETLERLGSAPTPVRKRTGRYTPLREGKPVLIPERASEAMAADAEAPWRADLLRALDLRSVLVLPLVARRRPLGIMAFGWVERGFDEGDIVFAETVATRAAVALDNSRLHREAIDASRAKSDFLRVMSHELRTPLTAVVGYADLLEMGLAGPVTDEQREKMHEIRENAQQLVEMIDEVLTFTRLEAGRERVRIARTDLGGVVREASSRYGEQAESKGLEFRVDVPPEGLVVETDADKVTHVLGDLLSNAIRFTESGSVTVRLRREGDDVVLEVADTGIGMTPEAIQRIFEPFWQAETGLTREYGGTGLGLAVANHLVQALGGEIAVESEPGKGSTFTVRIPVAISGGAD